MRFSLLLLLACLATTATAQIPQDSLALWFRADAGVFTDIFCTTPATSEGDNAYCWRDQSPNQIDAIRVGSATPTLRENVLNGAPSVRFDGSGGLSSVVSDALNFTTATIFIVANPAERVETHISVQASNSNLTRSFWAGRWSNDWNPGVIGIVSQGVNAASFARWTATPHQIDASAFPSLLLYGSWRGGSDLTSTLNGIESSIDPQCGGRCQSGLSEVGRSVLLGQSGDGGSPLNDDSYEIIIYGDIVLDAARGALIQNYLSAKYAIPINPPVDFYAGDLPANGDYDFDATGIGAEADSSLTEAQAAGLVIREANESLDAGEYVMAGHKVADNGTTEVGLPTGVELRWTRVWYVDPNGGSVDVELGFDYGDSGAGYVPQGDQYTLLYSATDGGAFTDLGLTPSIAGDQVKFEVSAAQLQAGYYTLGTMDGSISPVNAEDTGTAGPAAYALSAFPNPSAARVTVALDVVRPQPVQVRVYDVLGRQVTLLHDGALSTGTHRMTLDGRGLPGGVYFVRASGDDFAEVQRVVLTR